MSLRTVRSPTSRRTASSVLGAHVLQLFSFPSGDPAEFEKMTPADYAALEFAGWFQTSRSRLSQRDREDTEVGGLADKAGVEGRPPDRHLYAGSPRCQSFGQRGGVITCPQRDPVSECGEDADPAAATGRTAAALSSTGWAAAPGRTAPGNGWASFAICVPMSIPDWSPRP
jgi:hypothetical protein